MKIIGIVRNLKKGEPYISSITTIRDGVIQRVNISRKQVKKVVVSYEDDKK